MPRANRGAAPGGCLAAAVFLILLVAGGAILYARFYDPIVEMIKSQHWERVPAKIAKSDVEPAGIPGTFKPSIRYYYEYGGQGYRSTRIWFLKRGSDSRADVESIVARFPVGKQTFCYVNPDNPKDDVVLERGFKPALLVALIPLGMVLIGFAGFTSLIWRRAFPRAQFPALLGPRTHQTPSGLPAQLPPPGPIRRRARRGLKSGLLFALIIAAAWNTMMYFLAHEVVNNWRDGQASPYVVMLTLFSLPFLLSGLALAVLPLYLLRKLFHPRPTVTLSQPTVALGDSIDVSWRISGRIDKIRRLRVTLEGREEATYERDDETRSESEVFAAIPLAATRDSRQIRTGECALRMPADAAPSFESFHNKIAWSVRVYTDSRPWPGFDEQFELLVLPLPTPETRSALPSPTTPPSPSNPAPLPSQPEAHPA